MRVAMPAMNMTRVVRMVRMPREMNVRTALMARAAGHRDVETRVSDSVQEQLQSHQNENHTAHRSLADR